MSTEVTPLNQTDPNEWGNFCDSLPIGPQPVAEPLVAPLDHDLNPAAVRARFGAMQLVGGESFGTGDRRDRANVRTHVDP